MAGFEGEFREFRGEVTAELRAIRDSLTDMKATNCKKFTDIQRDIRQLFVLSTQERIKNAKVSGAVAVIVSLIISATSGLLLLFFA